MDKENNVPEYNRIDYENDTLNVQEAKQIAIQQQVSKEKEEKIDD